MDILSRRLGQPACRAPWTLDVVFMEHRWYNVRQQAEDGNDYWTWTIEDHPDLHHDSQDRRDRQGAVATFTPPSPRAATVSGDWHGRARQRDPQQHLLWVWGGGEPIWRQESTNRIDLITDQDEYRVGDVAEILIPSPYSGTVQALVTIERGHIIETEVRELRKQHRSPPHPHRIAHVPNVFVSVVLMQGSAQTPEALASIQDGRGDAGGLHREKELRSR